MDTNRDWTVLFIGGASGTGKSSVAYALGRYYGVNVLEVDDLSQAVEAVTTRAAYPALHLWETGTDWMDIGVMGNVNWLMAVSTELAPAIRAVVENHLESDVPVIIEGDFVSPELVASFQDPRVAALYIQESDRNQLLQNYQAREGGEPQHYRADISIEYGARLSEACNRLGVPILEARPWDTVQDRAIAALS